MGSVAQFETGYMDLAWQDPEYVVSRARKVLADVDFDTVVGTGLSGALVVPMIARALGKEFVLVQKPKDGSHHHGSMVGRLGHHFVFVDDFVSSGATRERVLTAIKEAIDGRWDYANGGSPFVSEYVGDFVYQPWEDPHDDNNSERGLFDDEEAKRLALLPMSKED